MRLHLPLRISAVSCGEMGLAKDTSIVDSTLRSLASYPEVRKNKLLGDFAVQELIYTSYYSRFTSLFR